MTKKSYRDKETILDSQHWQYDDYSQRMLRKDWQDLLLNNDDSVIYNGRLRQLTAKNLGAGVYEVRKEPLPSDDG